MTNRPRLTITRGVWVLVAALALCVGALWMCHRTLAVGLPQVTPPAPNGAVYMAATLVALVVGGIATHEAGHVLAAKLVRWRWIGVVIYAGVAVRFEKPDGMWTYRRQLVVSLGGPLVNLVIGALLVLLIRGGALPGWSPWGTLAAFSLGLSLELVLPTTDNSDGMKIWRCVWAIVRGRGSAPFPGV